ncbi:hypothetical protein ASPCAL01002 [Aspergillus calidoustus]|uniref:Protein kinase domain-containing protein n=1 Tax=Aspergillus calidoustus TaxID=454130 RepID=A0A0U5FPX0_ASPCI|nr:hypothetical protein ASPCAL01002 [Aspergillus calidoustus]
MLKTDWNYPADIWNVGAMVWDLFEGNTFSAEMTLTAKGIQPGRILQKSWEFSGHRLWICSSVENEAMNSLLMMENGGKTWKFQEE